MNVLDAGLPEVAMDQGCRSENPRFWVPHKAQLCDSRPTDMKVFVPIGKPKPEPLRSAVVFYAPAHRGVALHVGI
ncbi:hypothetical protein CBM2633_A70110 [Cupriavidus taiwanensis]|nr:hypothetical protein CBM2633_A70110 [Cupriavidus taiwanensis]